MNDLATDCGEIIAQADDYARTHRNRIVAEAISKFTPDPSGPPVSIFMAGSPGAGKTEVSKRLLEDTDGVLRIDADELRECFKPCGYDGANSHLFQKAATRLVHGIHDKALKKKISFLLDGTFSSEEMARQNITRSLKRSRLVYIICVYQFPEQAWHFVQQRERIEGRRIRAEDFAKKFCASYEVVNKMKAEFGEQVTLTLVIKNIDGSTKEHKKNIQRIEDHISQKHTEQSILSMIKKSGLN